ncbi:MAG: peptide chain release factor N(5)-glutamine methyltransferase [Candidatus Omnitrophica bacterium]|jgi:release factor glutamine methyltransferase|nr:peptide chain release factor N(5)-glutamine methyltransferase [Candidatus Omnitrophota bacterium]
MSCSKKIKHGELLELIGWGRAELSRSGVEEAQEECERILMKLLGCSRSEIYLKEHSGDFAGVRGKLIAILEKRAQRIPLAYLLKEADFWQETLYVDERCLIPRPETEILVEQVLKIFDKDAGKGFSFLDIGTGSGAIAIAILRARKNAAGTLLDASGAALEVARENLKRYELEARARQVQGDLFEPFSSGEKWDLIVSNPPYLSEKDWNGVQEELKLEPRMALDGGKDGLDFYRRIIAGAKDHLTSGGLLALEVGYGQAEKVSKWLQEAGYDSIQRFNDHLQVQRVVMAQRHS